MAPTSAASQRASSCRFCERVMARLSEGALRRLDEARERANALSEELSDPTIFEDARKAAEVGRAQAELSAVVEHYDRYQNLLGQLKQAEDLLRVNGTAESEDDQEGAEMQAMARAEIDEVEPQLESVIAD